MGKVVGIKSAVTWTILYYNIYTSFWRVNRCENNIIGISRVGVYYICSSTRPLLISRWFSTRGYRGCFTKIFIISARDKNFNRYIILIRNIIFHVSPARIIENIINRKSHNIRLLSVCLAAIATTILLYLCSFFFIIIIIVDNFTLSNQFAFYTMRIIWDLRIIHLSDGQNRISRYINSYQIIRNGFRVILTSFSFKIELFSIYFIFSIFY